MAAAKRKKGINSMNINAAALSFPLYLLKNFSINLTFSASPNLHGASVFGLSDKASQHHDNADNASDDQPVA